RDARHGPVQHLSLHELGRRLLLPRAPELLRRRLLRQDQAVATLIRLDDLQRKPLADEVAKRVGDSGALTRAEVAHGGELREGYEATEPKVDDETPAVRVHYFRLDDLTALRELRHPRPLPPAPRPACGEDDAAIRTFGLNHRVYTTDSDSALRLSF